MSIEWTVVTVIIALVGLFATVTKPIMSFNASIVKLTTKFDNLVESNKALDKKNTEIHDGIRSDIDTLKETSTDHESRITVLEVTRGGTK